MNRPLARLVAVVALVALVGCGDDAPKSRKKVEGPTAKIGSVEIEPAVLALAVRESRTLEVTVRGEGDFDPALTWETSDAGIAAVDAGLVTALEPGEATITATSKADPTKSATVEVTVTPAGPPETGRLEVSLQTNGAHPEPARARVKIRGPGGYEAEVHESDVLEDLLPGTYLVEAPSFFENLVMHSTVVQTPEVEVRAGPRRPPRHRPPRRAPRPGLVGPWRETCELLGPRTTQNRKPAPFSRNVRPLCETLRPGGRHERSNRQGSGHLGGRGGPAPPDRRPLARGGGVRLRVPAGRPGTAPQYNAPLAFNLAVMLVLPLPFSWG